MLDVVNFPLWWYSQGLFLLLKWGRDTLRGFVRYFALVVWIKNIFVPMFGQNDWQSRLISFVMRTVQIVGRSIGLIGVGMGVVLVLGLYLVVPIVVTLLAVYHVLGSLLYVS